MVAQPDTFDTLYACLATQAARYADKPFLFFPEQQTQLTYAHLWQQVQQVAHALTHAGVQPGDAVALWLPNIPVFPVVYWGCMVAGAVANPVNTLLAPPEVAYIINHSSAKVLVTTAEFADALAGIRDQLPQLQTVWLAEDGPNHEAETAPSHMADIAPAIPNSLPLAAVLAQQPAHRAKPADLTADSLAMMIYTSGTTGKPKGVLLTHGNLLANATSINRWFGLADTFVWMNVLPLFHVNGEVVTLMTPLVAGGSVVLNRKFSSSRFWPTIAQYGVNGVSVVPTLLSMLHGSADASLNVPSSLAFVVCGAAPLPVEVHRQFEARFGVPVFEGYGLSETTCYATFNPRDLQRRKIGSIGLPVDCDVQIMDEHHQPCPPDVAGEIVIQGPNVMHGYFNNPNANAKAFHNGYFYSGDWGRKDADGFVYIMDRVKDMIIRGGENIYPREIDEVLYQHPAIADAATIGIPDATYGEEVKSFVVLKPGMALTEAEVLAYCRTQLAAFKCPKWVSFIDDIPKGPTGKLLRRALRDP
jgi:acyl-CoA synthetase (AMP-forming)/AMP-acid ligase II